jgi:hypothetical protein
MRLAILHDTPLDVGPSQRGGLKKIVNAAFIVIGFSLERPGVQRFDGRKFCNRLRFQRASDNRRTPLGPSIQLAAE